MTAENVRKADAGRNKISLVQLNPQGAFQLAGILAGESKAGGGIGRASKPAATELGSGAEEQIRGGSRTEMARAAAKAKSIHQIHKFETLTGKWTY